MLVGETGFEPATLCSQSRCATRLRHSPCVTKRLLGLSPTLRSHQKRNKKEVNRTPLEPVGGMIPTFVHAGGRALCSACSQHTGNPSRITESRERETIRQAAAESWAPSLPTDPRILLPQIRGSALPRNPTIMGVRAPLSRVRRETRGHSAPARRVGMNRHLYLAGRRQRALAFRPCANRGSSSAHALRSAAGDRSARR